MSARVSNPLRTAALAVLTVCAAHSVSAQAPPAPKTEATKPATAPESDPDVALARKAALDWLALADAGKFDATWAEAASSFQKTQKKPDWVKGLGGARPKVGKVISRTFLNYEIRTVLPNLPPGKYITVRFTTVFDKYAKGAESVTLIRDGARGFRMMSYYLG